MAWPPVTHQDVETLLTSLRSTPWVGGAAATGTPSSSNFLRGDGTWAAGAGGGGGANSNLDHVYYVSKSGNNANDGLSWATAKLTINAGLTALGGNAGTVEVGDGVYQETINLVGNKTIRGQSRYGTVIELTANGNLVTVSNENNGRMEHIGLRFASSAVTGTLLYQTNAFTCDFLDVRFSGTTTANQIGLRYDANAGDCHFEACYWDSLAIGVRANSTLHLFNHCMFSGCTKAVEAGDPTGATAPGGAVFSSCVFRGAGSHYIHITGKSQAFHITGCWFDGAGANIAIEVGSATQGPWLFSLMDCPSCLGNNNNLIINKADMVLLHGVVFGNAGTNPTDLVVSATGAPRGSIASCVSLQSTKLETLVPPKWDGYRGYAASADSTVQLVETATDMNTPSFPQTHRKVVIRIANRSTGSAAVTLTFPSAFETTFGGGTFFKTFDNSGLGAGLVITNTTVTIPTGVAVTNAMIVIEGF